VARTTNHVFCLQEPLVLYRLLDTSMTRKVDTFFESGLEVLHRTVQEDKRIHLPLAANRFGFSLNFDLAIRQWYKRIIGLYLAQHNSKTAARVMRDLLTERKQSFEVVDFIDIWKNVLFGAVLSSAEQDKAWRIHGIAFRALVAEAEELYDRKGLAYLVDRKMKYWIAPKWKKGVLKILGRNL